MLAVAALMRSELTLACPPAIWTALLAAGQIHQYPDQAYLGHFGKPLPDVIMLVEGKIEVSRVGMDGKRHVVAYMRVGQVIGLLTIVDRKGSPEDFRCHGGVTVLRIPMDTVRKLCSEFPELHQAVLALICQRTRLLYDAMSAHVLLSLQARTAWILQSLVAVHGVSPGERQVLNLTISQTAMADLLGVARQSLNRELKLLERAGLLRLAKEQIEILDLPALQRLAAGGA